jgi:hypothetical protein
MDWAGAAVGLGGLGIAALTLWLTSRERTKWYRERLYDKRFEACLAICQAAAELEYGLWWGVARSADAEFDKQDSDPNRWHRVGGPRGRLIDLEQTWRLVLSENMSRALAELLEAATAVGKTNDNSAATLALLDRLEAAGKDLFQATRADLGIDRLSDETLKLIGVASKESAPRSAIAEAAKIAADGDAAALGGN